MKKICIRCSREKESKYANLCNSCAVIIDRNKHVKRFKDFVDKYKLEQGCIDCGYRKNSVALDFDHVRGEKLQTLSELVRGRYRYPTMDVILEEIAKCEIRCANCHRIVTKNRLLTN